MSAKGLVGIGLAAAVAAVAGYPLLWRNACLSWGASAVEVCREMPGDALLPGARLVSTRAVTVDAPASAVWPWLVQMGPGRGGAYTYDWIENLFGLDMHSADRILPEFQDLKLGDTMTLGDRGPVMEVAELAAERALVLRSQDGNWVWAFGLHPLGRNTRLVSRNRIEQPGASPAARLLTLYVMEPGSLLMERKMLLGIKRRAEALA
ncbi:hypothetical protein [Streptacidiphilus sp. EB129]|uniref:hypothetical protein n=1 Tax=Streptacidiphilus sp. EB129 TaxID=3156262 RepID=UPI003516A491